MAALRGLHRGLREDVDEEGAQNGQRRSQESEEGPAQDTQDHEARGQSHDSWGHQASLQ